MAIKLDTIKAYDIVEWASLNNTIIVDIGFRHRWICLSQYYKMITIFQSFIFLFIFIIFLQ